MDFLEYLNTLIFPIKGSVLDNYLEKGWYRMGPFVTPFDYLTVEDAQYPIVSPRYKVAQVQLSNALIRSFAKNQFFTVWIKPMEYTDELEALHALYRTCIDFETSETLGHMLMDDENFLFDSHLIELRDGDLLIAAGIFDKGTNSIAGIKNIYHPDYKKYSLGKYLMMLKYKYCVDNAIEWFYPGYFTLGYTKFDYKLFIDKNAIEIRIPSANYWIPYAEFILTPPEAYIANVIDGG